GRKCGIEDTGVSASSRYGRRKPIEVRIAESGAAVSDFRAALRTNRRCRSVRRQAILTTCEENRTNAGSEKAGETAHSVGTSFDDAGTRSLRLDDEGRADVRGP